MLTISGALKVPSVLSKPEIIVVTIGVKRYIAYVVLAYRINTGLDNILINAFWYSKDSATITQQNTNPTSRWLEIIMSEASQTGADLYNVPLIIRRKIKQHASHSRDRVFCKFEHKFRIEGICENIYWRNPESFILLKENRRQSSHQVGRDSGPRSHVDLRQ